MASTMAAGRLQHPHLTSNERHFAVWTHLSPLLAFMVIGPFAAAAPLILWMTRRETSSFVDDHGREVVNMSITGAFFFIIGLVTGIGVLVWLIWCVAALVNVVRGAIAAGDGEYFRYPMTIRFLKD